MKKPVYCCEALKSNLRNDCDQHGWCCPDNLLYFDEKNEWVFVPSNHDGVDYRQNEFWVIKHCPFCGAKIQIQGVAAELPDKNITSRREGKRIWT